MKQPRQGRTFERLNGTDGFAWGGIATKVDPAGNPPERPRDTVNVRHQGGVIVSRPSFRGDGVFIPLIPIHYLKTPSASENPPFVVTNRARWVPHWLAEHNNAAGVRLWCIAEAAVPNDFARIMFIDTDADLCVQTLASIRQQQTGHTFPIEKFDNEIYFGDINGLRKLYLIPSREGDNSPPIDTDQIADDVIVSTPGFRVAALQSHAGLLFFAIAGSPVGEIYAWDGQSVGLEVAMVGSSGDVGCHMAVYKDTLVVAVRDYIGAGQGALLVRDATGAWTTHTLASFNVSRYPNSIVEYGNLLYVVDGADQIHTWDGSNIALAHTLPLGSSALNVIAKLGRRLYFPYSDGSQIELGYVDDLDAAGFIDIGTRDPVRADTLPPVAMSHYRGRLWISFDGGAGAALVMWHSQQFMPFSGWQSFGDDQAFTDESISYLITNMRSL